MPDSSLNRQLGLIHVFCIASGAMISSGLFILPGLAHAQAGPAVVLSYLIGALLATAGGLSIAELATAMPKAGGDYFFVARSVGAGTGTVAGLLSWFSLSLKSAFAIVGMATFTILVISLNGLLAGVFLCAVFTALNLVGVKEAARAQVLLVAGLFALLILYVVTGMPRVRVQYFEPFAPHGLVPVFSTAGYVFVSFGGLLNVASISEEVRNPGRVIPMGLILSLALVSVLYVLVVFVTSGILGAGQLDNSMTPISDGARVAMGRAGFVALSVGAILAFVSTANAGIMSASRYLYALSRDGLLPGVLGRVDGRFRTPVVAVVLTGAVIAVSLFLPLNTLVEAASTVLILTNILACLAVIVLRESGMQNYRPAFRVPFYPWIQIGGIIGLGFVLREMGEDAYLVTALLILAGFLVYWFYGRKRGRRESALLHLLERLTSRDFASGTLEGELKDIIRERDDIAPDRLDRSIENCAVLDLEGNMARDEFFRAAAEELAPRLGATAMVISEKLDLREDESSTVISPGLAVPHIIIDGKGMFEILLARARKGVRFSEDAPCVTTVVIMAGTQDQRNLHLKALAAIAQIGMEPGIEERWLKARNAQALRDILLLGTRKRERGAPRCPIPG